jgi:dihydroorotase
MSRFGSLSDPAATFVLSGARVVDPSAGEDQIRDLAVVDGLLADPASLPADATRVDGSGLVVAPGLCDLHAHLREPGLERAETIESGAQAAARGGFTTICAMPNTDPPLDDPESVRWVLDRASGAACRVRVVATATRGRAGEGLTDVEDLAKAGVAGVSDDGTAVSSETLVRELLTRLASLGLPLIEHAEDLGLTAGAVMRAGPTATRLGLAGWPEGAELSIVERDIALAEETGAWVHFTHLSTAGGLDVIRRAKERDVRVTCDVTPHHLALTDAWVAGWRGFAWEEPAGLAADPFGAPLDAAVAYDSACRVNPPLPSRVDALALLEGVADGSIDAIATDHAPHVPEAKERPFEEAPPGMLGLETAFALTLTELVEPGVLALHDALACLSWQPAAIAGLDGHGGPIEPGRPANLCVVDPAVRWEVDPSRLASRSRNTPYAGRKLTGRVRHTVLRGEPVVVDGIAQR